MTLYQLQTAWVVTTILVTCVVRSVAAPPPVFNYPHQYLVLADSLLKTTEYERAIVQYNKAKLKFARDNDWQGIVKCNNKISFCYRKLSKYDEMLALLKATLPLAKHHLGKSHLLTAETKFCLGEYYFRQNEPTLSLLYYDSVSQIVVPQNMNGVLDLECAAIYNNIGAVYQYRLSNSQKASTFFQKALAIRQRLLTEFDLDLATSYYNMSTLNRSIGNYEAAIEYGLKAVQLSRKNVYEKSFQANCVLIVANTYFDELHFKEAIHYYSKAIEMMIETKGASDVSLAMYYNNIGTAYNEIKEHSRAMQYFAKALYVNEINNYADIESQADSYFNYGLAYQFLSKQDSAKYFFKKSLVLKKSFAGEKHPTVSINYQYLGDVFESQRLPDSALWYYQKALIAAIEGFNVTRVEVNPLKEQIGLDQHLIMTLRYKARSLRQKFDQSRDKKYLQLAMNTFLLADSAIVIYRNHFFKEGTKLILSYVFKNTFEDAIETAHQLFQLTKDQKFAWFGLQFMEQTKAMYLREFVEKQKRFKASVPDSLLQKDTELIFQLGELKQLLKSGDHVAEESWQDSVQSEIFKVAQAHEQLNEHLRRQYPDFFDVKYASVISPASITDELTTDALIVEYFWGERFIYSIALQDDEIFFLRQPKAPVQNALSVYRQEITNPIVDQDAKTHFQRFSAAAFELFTKLIRPIVNDNTPHQIIVVPDGELLYIPFDAFIKSVPRAIGLNYKTLPYLINDYQFSYQYSLTLMNSLKRIKVKPAGNLLGFAYSANGTSMATSRFTDTAIPGTSKEVSSIAAMIDGKYFYGPEATEKNFKLNASDFSVIHFALHGAASDSLSSAKLIFTHSTDDDEDGFLYPHELYSVKLNADLVVLSSCETGIGKLYDGEGTYSMARGFVLAGCPSVVMTLWKISDNATAPIMTEFYNNISDGNAVDESMRTSKLAFLNSATELGAHPSNWAAFVPLGQMSPVNASLFSARTVAILMTSVMVLILGVFLYVKKM